MTARSNDTVLLGHISGAHGIKGEVVIKSYAEVPENIAAYGSLSDEAGERVFVIQSLRSSKKGLIARIEGVVDRDSAEALAGTKLYVGRSALPELIDEGAYYATDLIGLEAFDVGGVLVGHIVAIQNYGAGDLIEIRIEATRETELLPFEERFIPVVDIPGGRVVIVMPTSSEEPSEKRT